MATYKVPQDVEADDKLIGFLSLKQFIFVLLGMGFGYLTFFFFTKVHPVTAVIWILPSAAFFILGLYQRRDQPVEIYLASAIRFHLKPHTRIWDQEGYEERVIITAPPKIARNYTKGYSQDQVSSHLGSLSRLMDTRGWASKLVTDWQNPDLQAAADSDRLVQPNEVAASSNGTPSYAQPVDVQDASSSPVARDFEAKIQQVDSQTHQNAIKKLQAARSSDDGAATTSNAVTPTQAADYVTPLQPTAASPLQESTAAPQPVSPPVPVAAADDTTTALPDDEVEINLR